jgi:tRNA(fMet)-specific endonuclease VapC
LILLDIDICIDFLRNGRKLIEIRKNSSEDFAVCFMTAAELYYGAFKSDNPAYNMKLVDDFLMTLKVFETDQYICKRFGGLKAELAKNGNVLTDADIFIASCAYEKCSCLVTGNIRHFEKFKALKLLNWREE